MVVPEDLKERGRRETALIRKQEPDQMTTVVELSKVGDKRSE